MPRASRPRSASRPKPRPGRLLAPRLCDNTKVLIEAYRAIVRATPRASADHAGGGMAAGQFPRRRGADSRDQERSAARLSIASCPSSPTVRWRDIRACSASPGRSSRTPTAPSISQKLTRFVEAYQRVQPLTIGELWAVAITLRIMLVENLRRLAEAIVARLSASQLADALADRLLGTDGSEPEPAATDPAEPRPGAVVDGVCRPACSAPARSRSRTRRPRCAG